ncbi:hypothetical protein [Albimonas pacifica]|uniref:Uncharacterized protein n=1 Tax=Albimonas pacifica TaxID=1114924 RepID=A0A1I3EGM5_9RHOB|nr:hypothetical protein [Albimonas pacifica]SFH98079.1 hypothetical protein SAMN05216258_103365 [Albimonas pacifica]
MLLGCDSQKALAALFREADPDTDFDVARSYKWMQGRAAPRSAKLYEEWAALLDVGRPGSWLAACDLATFVATLEIRHGDAAAGLRASLGLPPDAAVSREPRAFLPGRFALYSMAQSPYYEDKLIRADLHLAPAAEAESGHLARVRESFAGVEAAWSGEIERNVQGLSGELRSESDAFGPVYLALVTPTLPASLLAGVTVGFVSLQPGAQRPYAARIAAVRVPPAAGETLSESNRYIDTDAEVAADLRALGLPVDRAPDFVPDLVRWLRRPVASDRPLSPATVTDLVSAADRIWLATL